MGPRVGHDSAMTGTQTPVRNHSLIKIHRLISLKMTVSHHNIRAVFTRKPACSANCSLPASCRLKLMPHAPQDSMWRLHVTQTGKLYKPPTETKNVYMALSVVRVMCLLFPSTAHTLSDCHLETLASGTRVPQLLEHPSRRT